ncbi:hypothetical protein ACH4TQ_27470 [Streptomyces sp. NPDC021218]|uniref:hypothetical protein n=1 Tax=Streptomyces sp. NPDC021218 TaxID=3365119 RepID=UPI0037A19DE9
MSAWPEGVPHNKVEINADTRGLTNAVNDIRAALMFDTHPDLQEPGRGEEQPEPGSST